MTTSMNGVHKFSNLIIIANSNCNNNYKCSSLFVIMVTDCLLNCKQVNSTGKQ